MPDARLDQRERGRVRYFVFAFVGFIIGVVVADVRKWWDGR